MALSKTTKSILIGFGIFVALILVAIIAIAVAIGSGHKPNVRDKSVLVVKLSGAMPDYSPENEMARVFGISEAMSVTDAVTQLRKAKVDSRIGAVLIDINFPEIGWGKAEELREAIKDVRASNKPVYAYMELGQNKEYFIASAAEKIFLPPAGDLYVNGLAANAMFYRGTLDKLGVEAEVIQIGKYKNAPDQYTRKDMSEGQREVLNAVLDGYFQRLTEAVAESRNKTVEDVKAMIDAAPFNASQAKAQGLIDEVMYRDQVYDDLKNRLGYGSDEKLRTVTAVDYREIGPESVGINKGEKVAVVYVSGTINVGSSSDGGGLTGDTVGSDTIVKAVNAAAASDSIKAIILRVDSPGGSALASDIMWNAIENAKMKKPVVVSMSDVAASGGYYIASNASRIVAQPTTITGSIGVFLGKPVVRGMYDWMGISNEYVMRGKNAGIFRETEKWTPEERAKMQEAADNIYFNAFVPKVAKGRNMTDEAVNAVAQGRVWTGAQAKEKGLVDEIGGLETAIQAAKQLAGIPAEKEVKRVFYPEPKSFIETLFGSDDSAKAKEAAKAAIVDSLPEHMRKAFYFAGLFDRMRNGEAMLVMPMILEIK